MHTKQVTQYSSTVAVCVEATEVNEIMKINNVHLAQWQVIKNLQNRLVLKLLRCHYRLEA